MAVDTAVKPSLTVKRRLKAPPAKVFAAWTDPEKIKRWMGPGEIVAQRIEADARAGGRYRIEMRKPSGEAHNVGGVYREIIANEKLVFTWSWDPAPGNEPRESLVTVLLKPEAGGTLLTLIHEHLFDEETRVGHEGGWTAPSTSSKGSSPERRDWRIGREWRNGEQRIDNGRSQPSALFAIRLFATRCPLFHHSPHSPTRDRNGAR